MRRISITTAFLLFSLPSIAQIKKDPLGFRELRWGDPFVESDYIVQESKRDYSVYKKIDERKQIGSIELLEITYQFREQKFVGVQIEVKKEECADLEDVLDLRHGPATRKDGSRNLYFLQWRGNSGYVRFVRGTAGCSFSIRSM